MARIRTIKPKFWDNTKLSNVSRDARLTYIGMWVSCDDRNFLPKKLKQLKLSIPDLFLPEKNFKSIVKILLMQGFLIDRGLTYEVIPVQLGSRSKTSEYLKEWMSLRQEVFKLYGFKCYYCGAEKVKFEIDHMIPVSKGGLDVLSNLVVACFKCNRKKGKRTAEEYFNLLNN